MHQIDVPQILEKCHLKLMQCAVHYTNILNKKLIYQKKQMVIGSLVGILVFPCTV